LIQLKARGAARASIRDRRSGEEPMSTQGLEMIDHTVQMTHEWLNALAHRIDTGDRRQALRLLRGVLHTLRDRLPHEESAHLASQLPVLLRGIYYEGWRPAATPRADADLASFAAAVAEHYEAGPGRRVEEDVSEVFRLLNDRISEGEIGHVRSCLPEDLRTIWPA
jgi:uncharacterized protein (DUF2267 family)